MNVRPGTLKDLNAMTDILIAASPDDPAYDYRFPDRNLYPTVFETVCRQKCREYLENHYVVVCEFSGYGVVAFSVWDLPSKARAAASRRHRPSEPSCSCTATLARSSVTIGNQARQLKFRKVLADYKKTLDAHYNNHVFLRILMTHPNYRRRGAGTKLTEWGVNLARSQRIPTTVFASPMGLKLYEKLGFRKIMKCCVNVKGDTESLKLPVLVKPPT
ncbi:hypothetical protein VTH82DRAFT_1628 [Thermothelomyces myriococcoides]